MGYFFVSAEEALEHGLTHEGTVYGVPAWLSVSAHGVASLPKLYMLRHFCNMADACLAAMTYFVSADTFLEVPHTIKGPIKRPQPSTKE